MYRVVISMSVQQIINHVLHLISLSHHHHHHHHHQQQHHHHQHHSELHSNLL